MADLTKEELKQFILETTSEKSSASKTEGSKMPDSSKYLTVKDFEHQKALAQLSADAEKKEAEYQQTLKTVTNQRDEALDPNHRKHCTGSNCQISQVHTQIFNEGIAYAKQHLAVDDISPKLVGDWIREMMRRRKEGK